MPTQPPLLKLDMAHVDGACVIRIQGELDIAGCPAVELALEEARHGQAERVFLDLEEVTFIDARGLRAILEASRSSTSNGNRVQITRGNGLLARMFRLTELDKLLPLTDSWLSPAIRDAGPRAASHSRRGQPDRTRGTLATQRRAAYSVNRPIDCNSAPTIEGRTLPQTVGA